MRRSHTSKYKKLTELKRIARSFGWGEVMVHRKKDDESDDDPWIEIH